MANKAERHAAILELIAGRAVGSQRELQRLLRQRGWDVTQATLSRDLRELRIARVPDPAGGARYATAGGGAGGDEGADGRGVLDTLLPQLFLSADGVSELAVLRTRAGGAQAVAEALDSEAWPDVLGTIAGDNTILIICRSAGGRERMVRRLRTLGGGGGG
ncbi:MAG TPA: hypothetical protein VNA89_09100 [Gemmatimonadaceae bacterium]|nr:hypothetical protein [Gemmatimonadaceae bacterium]